MQAHVFHVSLLGQGREARWFEPQRMAAAVYISHMRLGSSGRGAGDSALLCRQCSVHRSSQ